MAMTNAQIEKKLRQHDNEIVSIYDMLAEIRGTVDQHTSILGQHTAMLEQHTQMLTEILRRLPEAS